MSLRAFERVCDDAELYNEFGDTIGNNIRVAVPGIIQAVDFKKQTCEVQLSIREIDMSPAKPDFKSMYEWEQEDLPLLTDVPFFVLGCGDYCITAPIKEGDECLVVFADMCIDGWWQNGDIQNQIDLRRHDLSDGFALVGFRSNPHVVEGYSERTFQIRNGEGSLYLELDEDNRLNIVNGDDVRAVFYDDEILLKNGTDMSVSIESGSITLSGKNNAEIKIDSDGKITVSAPNGIEIKSPNFTINGNKYMEHKHPRAASGLTGTVVP